MPAGYRAAESAAKCGLRGQDRAAGIARLARNRVDERAHGSRLRDLPDGTTISEPAPKPLDL